MPFFQNVFDAEFQGSLLLSDRQFNMTFKAKGNSPNSSTLFQAWNPEPFDVSTNATLTLNYSFDAGNSWTALAIDVSTTATSTSAAKATEIVSALNANSTFQALFTASVQTYAGQSVSYVAIKSTRSREKFKVYVSNTGAEISMRFNKRAGVAEFPTYFARHTIANKPSYPDSVGMLQQLDLTTTRDQTIVKDANFTHVVGVTNSSATATLPNTAGFVVGDSVVVFDGTTTLSTTISTVTANTSLTLGATWVGSTGTVNIVVVHADYQLLRGRSGIFNFQKITVDGSDRITQIIEYPAGALVGDLSRKIKYTYTGGNTHPTTITEEPYTIASTDLIVP
jgi:hypothetical protein